jgi:ABC-type dipeptide/oligopeptide/nickel transport system permease subunit
VNRRQIDRSLELEGGADFVQWNADGTRFLTAQGQRVLLWDTLSWRPTATIELDGERVAVAWNSNGTLVMTASGTTVALWNVFTGTAVATLDHDSPLTSAVFNKTTSKLLTTTASGTLHIWNASTFQEELVIEHDGPLANGAWAENISRGVQYVMASSDNTALVWSATNGESVLELDHGEPVEKIAGSPLATRIFTQSANRIRVWEAGSGKEVLNIKRETPIVDTEWQNTGGGILVASGNELDVVKTSNYQYLMGVDGNVRDQFSRVIYGTRLSLMVGFVTVTLAVVVGTVSGAIAGFLGGWVDNTIMRVMDVMLAFPSLILAIAVVTVLGPGLINALLAISIVFIPAYARVARSGVLAVREEDFVIADRALGVSNTRILFHRILPNALAPLIVQATLGIGTAILDAAALSFLGLGAQPPTPEWGAMLGSERNQVFTAPHLVFYPGIAIMITVLAFNLLGDGLRDALDPRLDR